VELRISVEGLDPPTGLAIVDGRETWKFVGWIELLQALERLQEEKPTPPARERTPDLAY
jgi:hypothetical protein